MEMSTWNLEYALQLQGTKTILFYFHDFFVFPKDFHKTGLLNLIKTMLKFVRVL